jgi:hypothetical protein
MSRLCSALTAVAVAALALAGFAGHASAAELPSAERPAAAVPAVDWQHGQVLVCGATCHVAQASTLVAGGVAHPDDPALARALAADPSSSTLHRPAGPAGPSCVASMPGLCFPTDTSGLSGSAGNWSWT